jgi:hypothetical protein
MSLLGGLESTMVQTLSGKFEVENQFVDDGDQMLLVTIISFDGREVKRHELDLSEMYEAFAQRLK